MDERVCIRFTWLNNYQPTIIYARNMGLTVCLIVLLNNSTIRSQLSIQCAKEYHKNRAYSSYMKAVMAYCHDL
ncbi:uncharacterized protein H6S33_010354 [Morchella sextelata]|uniref:uncharacterized protein n=1 Tax=Morchella sextelata TaxID=1174677 RepID=UPI001D054326|nr:uncharacterized protein H6S33_010354 [Morchella sextelata]KAH0612302.1 hypothetical protein H6S33_010354 [Morchella sextelata]